MAHAPTIDPSSVSSDAPDFFRVSNITVRQVPDMNAFTPAPNLDHRTSALVREPRRGPARAYRAGNAITAMQRVWPCPAAVPLAQSLQATRRDLARQHGLDPHAFEQLHAAALRRGERAFFKSCGPGQAYNELANVVKDLLPILPADVRGRRNPPIVRRRARTAAGSTRLTARRRDAERAALFHDIDRFERRHEVEQTRAFAGHSKAELHGTLRELGDAGCPDVEEEFEDEETGEMVVRVHSKAEYRDRLAAFVRGHRTAGFERSSACLRVVAASASGDADGEAAAGADGEGKRVERCVRVEPAHEQSTGGIRVYVWEAGRPPAERLHLLLTTDHLQHHRLRDPPDQQPAQDDASWGEYVDHVAARLELCETGAGAAVHELRVAPEPLVAETQLPAGFRLDAARDEEQQFALSASGAGQEGSHGGADGDESLSRSAMARSARNRRRASVLPTSTTIMGRPAVASREKITQFFKY